MEREWIFFPFPKISVWEEWTLRLALQTSAVSSFALLLLQHRRDPIFGRGGQKSGGQPFSGQVRHAGAGGWAAPGFHVGHGHTPHLEVTLARADRETGSFTRVAALSLGNDQLPPPGMAA